MTGTQLSDRELRRRIAYFRKHPAGIDHRLAELDGEWDTDRLVEASAAGVALGSLGVAWLFGRRWLTLAFVALAMLLQQSISGWSPPFSLFRRAGCRTPAEIEREREALRILRGDHVGLWGQHEGAGERLEE